MIITRLHNGLGNQMFQYAAGLALAHHHRTTLKLDISWFDTPAKQESHEKYGLSCFNICEQFATQEECSSFFPQQPSRAQRLIFGRPKQMGTSYFQREWGYDPLFFSLPINTHLDGYFQHPGYFEPIQDTLRSHFSFRYPPSEKVAAFVEKIRSSSPSVFMHFRRQDYLGVNSVYGPLQFNYYLRALKELKARLGSFTVFIFSDDIESLEKEITLDVPHHFVKATDPHNFYDKIRLMSLCDHGIISNSTFAWWGAWLNPSKNKIVLAPNPWHADQDPQFRTLKPVPQTWLKIDRDVQRDLALAE